MIQVEAYELIEKVHMMHKQIINEAMKKDISFHECLGLKQFIDLTHDEERILNSVKPFENLKELVSNINTWNEDKNVLDAFIEAIESESAMEF